MVASTPSDREAEDGLWGVPGVEINSLNLTGGRCKIDHGVILETFHLLLDGPDRRAAVARVVGGGAGQEVDVPVSVGVPDESPAFSMAMGKYSSTGRGYHPSPSMTAQLFVFLLVNPARPQSICGYPPHADQADAFRLFAHLVQTYREEATPGAGKPQLTVP